MTKQDQLADELIKQLPVYNLWEDAHGAFVGIWQAYRWMQEQVETLRGEYPPAFLLPGDGQRLWRELQAAVEAISEDDQLPFFRAMDPFLGWLVSYYQPAQDQRRDCTTSSAKAKVRGKRKRQTQNDLAVLQAALHAHHFPPGREDWVAEPLSQANLAELLEWSQSSVSRRMAKVFPEGMKGYQAACRSGTLRGFRQKYEDGTGGVEAVYDPEAE